MPTVHRVRGIHRVSLGSAAILALSSAWLAPLASAANTAPATAEMGTYSRDAKQTYFALTLTPPAVAKQDQPRDVVIVFNTAASQTGAYRDAALAALDACVAKLHPQDRVQILAADLEARPMSEAFVAAGSPELKNAVAALRREAPLGATDMEKVLSTAARRFDKDRPEGRVLVYIGDGRSPANMVTTESFRGLVDALSKAHISVNSYGVGPQCDGRMLLALSNQTGGNVYIENALVRANKAEKVSDERANDENARRGATVGGMIADWARASIYWPTAASWPADLDRVYPKNLLPLRSDRESIVVGASSKSLKNAVEFGATADLDGKRVELHWSATPQGKGDAYSYLPQLVDIAQRDGGLTLPTLGTRGLEESGRMVESGVDGLTDLAERAVATGDIQTAQVAAKTALERDPGNIKAKTVQQVIERKRTPAKPMAQKTVVAEKAPVTRIAQAAPAAAPANSGDLNLVRPAQDQTLPPPAGQAPASAPANLPPPAAGSLTDQFAAQGALLDDVEQQRRVFGQMLRREVENTIIDARRTMAGDPQTAIQNLKLALQNVERAPELTPELRAQLIDRLQIALRESQHQASIKDELDAQRQEEQAAARERRLLNERLSRNREKEKQLVDRFDALIDEGHYDDALRVAATIGDVDPTGVTPVVALASTEIRRNNYLMQLTRAERWTNFFDTMYQVEKSSVPFPDDPPIVYPAAPIWEELSNRRKDRYGAMDLKATGEAEQRIDKALRSPLTPTGLDFTDSPLKDVAEGLSTDYNIPVQLDKQALEEAGVGTDAPVTVSLHNITLRSALRLMLKSLGLTYIIQDEVLLITTKETAEQQLVVKVYPVADLVLPIDATQLQGMGGGGGIGGGGGGGLGGGGGGGLGGGGGGLGGGGGGFGGGGGGVGGGGGGPVSAAAKGPN